MMNITQDTKNKLIHAMIRHAAKRQAAPTAKAARVLDKMWRELFAKHISLVIPELPRDRWAPLLQVNVLNSIKGTINVITVRTADKHRDTDSTKVGEAGRNYGNDSGKRPKVKGEWDAVRRAVNEEWGGFLNFAEKHTSDWGFEYWWKTSHADLPSVPGLSSIFHPDVPIKDKDRHLLPYSDAAYKLSLEADRLIKAYFAVLDAGKVMYDDLTTILSSVRTVKQLEEQFPEAVPFLPTEFTEKVRNVKQVADPRLIERSREMLLTGIPN